MPSGAKRKPSRKPETVISITEILIGSSNVIRLAKSKDEIKDRREEQKSDEEGKSLPEGARHIVRIMKRARQYNERQNTTQSIHKRKRRHLRRNKRSAHVVSRCT